VDLKLNAAAAHVSQFDPSIQKYRPDWDPAALEKLKQGLRARSRKKDGHVVEGFRIAREFNQQ
jgi:hypothetical protein